MALLGRRGEGRQERREERRGGGGDVEVYQMREKLVSFGDDFWIETNGGRRAFKVDGKVARIRDTLVIRDVAGNEVAKVQERKIAIRDTMSIERPGRPDATIKKALINPLRERFTLQADDIGRSPSRATSSTTSTSSNATAQRSQRCPSDGCAFATPMGSRSPPVRTSR